MSTTGHQTLKKTLRNEGFDSSLNNFKKFLREIKDGNDDPDDPQGDCEIKLQFIFDLKKPDFKNIQTKYFEFDSLVLDNNTLRLELKNDLKQSNKTDNRPVPYVNKIFENKETIKFYTSTFQKMTLFI